MSKGVVLSLLPCINEVGIIADGNDFIALARKIYGDEYDYSKVEYKNMRSKVRIICRKHGEFWQVPYTHMTGIGCLRCLAESENGTT